MVVGYKGENDLFIEREEEENKIWNWVDDDQKIGKFISSFFQEDNDQEMNQFEQIESHYSTTWSKLSSFLSSFHLTSTINYQELIMICLICGFYFCFLQSIISCGIFKNHHAIRNQNREKMKTKIEDLELILIEDMDDVSKQEIKEEEKNDQNMDISISSSPTIFHDQILQLSQIVHFGFFIISFLPAANIFFWVGTTLGFLSFD